MRTADAGRRSGSDPPAPHRSISAHTFDRMARTRERMVGEGYRAWLCPSRRRRSEALQAPLVASLGPGHRPAAAQSDALHTQTPRQGIDQLKRQTQNCARQTAPVQGLDASRRECEKAGGDCSCQGGSYVSRRRICRAPVAASSFSSPPALSPHPPPAPPPPAPSSLRRPARAPSAPFPWPPRPPVAHAAQPPSSPLLRARHPEPNRFPEGIA